MTASVPSPDRGAPRPVEVFRQALETARSLDIAQLLAAVRDHSVADEYLFPVRVSAARVIPGHSGDEHAVAPSDDDGLRAP